MFINSLQEEEAILRAHGVIEDDSESGGLLLNDASVLVSINPQPSPLKKPGPLPHGPDPWNNEKSIHHASRESGGVPLRNFRKQMERNESDEVARGCGNNSEQIKSPQKTKGARPDDQPSQNRPKSAVAQVPGSNNIQYHQNTPTEKPVPSNATKSAKVQDLQKPPAALTKNQDDKRNESRLQGERRLELEGAPKSRKTNPLDRVVAKLSGKSDSVKDGTLTATGANAEEPRHASGERLKNLTVNLTELMVNGDEESEVSIFLSYLWID